MGWFFHDNAKGVFTTQRWHSGTNMKKKFFSAPYLNTLNRNSEWRVEILVGHDSRSIRLAPSCHKRLLLEVHYLFQKCRKKKSAVGIWWNPPPMAGGKLLRVSPPRMPGVFWSRRRKHLRGNVMNIRFCSAPDPFSSSKILFIFLFHFTPLNTWFCCWGSFAVNSGL